MSYVYLIIAITFSDGFVVEKITPFSSIEACEAVRDERTSREIGSVNFRTNGGSIVGTCEVRVGEQNVNKYEGL